MAWRFRRSIQGPLGLRINFGRSGIALSEGVRGFRVGRDARGKIYSQTSIPHTGIYRRDYAPGPPDPRSRPRSGAGAVLLLLLIVVVIAVLVTKALSH